MQVLVEFSRVTFELVMSRPYVCALRVYIAICRDLLASPSPLRVSPFLLRALIVRRAGAGNSVKTWDDTSRGDRQVGSRAAV